MTKKLSILIPCYNETESMIKRLLDSIAIQQRVNFDEVEVLVMHDGEDNPFSDELFQGYPYELNYYISRHRGISATRNELLDKAKGEYIQWVDADDFFHSAWAFFPVFREMKIGFDALVGNFLTEQPLPDNSNEFVITEMQMNGMQFVHNKVYKRMFLIKNDIRFCEQSNVHEDHVIMGLAKAYSQNIKYQPTPTFTWAWNENSVCRKDPLYLQKTTKWLLKNSAYMCEKLLKRGRNDVVREVAYSMLMDIYYSLNAKAWLETANKEFRDECEGYFKHYFNHYGKYAKDLTQEKKDQIIAGQKMMHTQQGVLLESITFDSWLAHIEKDVEPIDFEIEKLFDKA